MSLPDALAPDRLRALPRPKHDENSPASPLPSDLRLAKGPIAKAKALARRLVGRAVASQLAPVRETLSEVDRRMRTVETAAQRLSEVEVDVARVHAAGADSSTAIGLELLKGEVRGILASLDVLGQAIAPAAGLDGVPARFTELRHRVNSLDRRLRMLETTPASPLATSESLLTNSPPDEVSRTRPTGTSFDYVAFERRFRGNPDEVVAQLEVRYADLLSESSPVLDIGCGSGDLVARLASRGIDARGIDLDSGMVTEARARGLSVEHGDALDYLETLEDHSLGAIVAIHVVEHLELAQLTRLLELAASRLRPGGVLVAETPNPTSLIVLGNSFILDPTHVWPLHPSLMVFLCEGAGFGSVEVRMYSPAEGYRRPPVAATNNDAPAWVDEINERFAWLDEVLFGPQEYAVVARTLDTRAD